jgi:hypothetical protein
MHVLISEHLTPRRSWGGKMTTLSGQSYTFQGRVRLRLLFYVPMSYVTQSVEMAKKRKQNVVGSYPGSTNTTLILC